MSDIASTLIYEYLANMILFFYNRTILLQELYTTLNYPLHVLNNAYVLVFSKYRPTLLCLRTLFAHVRHSPIYKLCISS